MEFTTKAIRNFQDYDLYVKIVVDEYDNIEYQICYNSDDSIACDCIWYVADLISILEEWGEED